MDVIREAVNRGAEYADLRHDIRKMYTLARESRKTVSDGVQIDAGFCLRVLVEGSWGAGVATREENLPSLLSNTLRSARALKKNTTKIKEARSETVKSEKKAKKYFVDVDKLDFIKSLEASAYDESDRITSMTLVLNAIERSLHLLTSEARAISTHVDKVSLRVVITCKEGNSIESRVKIFGGIGGMEYLLEQEDALRQEVCQLAREADILVDADHPPSSFADCVLSHALTGTLLHEAFGHAVEADSVISNRSVLTKRIGEKIAADNITMADDPTLPIFGYYPYDHEGVEARKTTVIEQGILKSFLHSRETAALLDAELTGHCKAEYYSNLPLVRQGNTVLLPRDQAFGELLDIKEGLFLGDSSGGQANIGDGTFTFGTQYVREIKNGELGRYLKGCSLSGNITETMKKVDAVGKEVESVAAVCGKGQMDLQGWLIPMVRAREVMVGG
ncbi:MAG: TldD/PmbA family protein [Theionarchaea archaeon]|nr:TldD/PmbA family protein [Theionarchaea archaeon]